MKSKTAPKKKAIVIKKKTVAAKTIKPQSFVGFRLRFLAFAMDLGICAIPLIGGIVNLIFYFRDGQTIGYKIIGAKIYSINGNKINNPSGYQLAGRLLATILLSPIVLAFMRIGRDKNKRGWHDYLAKTIVVDETETKKIQFRNIKAAIINGRKQTNKQFRKLAVVVFIIGIAQILISGVSQYTGVQMGFGPDVGYRPVDFIGSIIGMWLGLGFADIAIRTNQNQSWTVKTLFANIHLLGKYIIAYILMALCIVGGLILLVIPGIYIAYRLSFMQYYMVDQNSGPIDALKQSRYATKGHVRKLIGLSLLFVLINILGLLVVGIGLLWTIPTTIIAYAYVYERIK